MSLTAALACFCNCSALCTHSRVKSVPEVVFGHQRSTTSPLMLTFSSTPQVQPREALCFLHTAFAAFERGALRGYTSQSDGKKSAQNKRQRKSRRDVKRMATGHHHRRRGHQQAGGGNPCRSDHIDEQVSVSGRLFRGSRSLDVNPQLAAGYVAGVRPSRVKKSSK